MSNIRTCNQGCPEIVNKNCAGIDVHRDFVSVTQIIETDQHQLLSDYREFRTVKKELLKMRDWLVDSGCTAVGLESTGKYWFPVHNVLEGEVDVKVYNARHMKNIPGKKTDKADSAWIAKITRNDLLQSSYIPEKQIRDARLLSRMRKSLVQIRSQIRQMILGTYDAAGIKLSSVVSDVFGTSGRNLTDLLLNREIITEEKVIDAVYGPLCNRAAELMSAMDGYMRDTHIYVISTYLKMENQLSDQIKQIEARLHTFLIDTTWKKELLERIIGIPGFTERSALLLISEIGYDLKTFSNEKKFCSWAGLAPGKNESAGKNRSGKIQVRQRYLRALMIEVALSATRCKDSYIKTKYSMLKNRIGGKKAVVAIAHCLAKAIYRAIKDGMEYKELTSDYVSKVQRNRDVNNLTRLANRMGKDTIIELVNALGGHI